jgi:hypothetical protein
LNTDLTKIKSGLLLTEPHCELLYQGKKSSIIKVNEYPQLEEKNILVSEDKAYGVIQFGKPEKLNSEQFEQREKEHHISKEERLRWWFDKSEFYSYKVKEFVKFETPREVNKISGQVFVDNVEFKDAIKEKISKPEVTENLIRIPVDSGNHKEHRIRTISINDDDGIKALYCGTCKKIMTYLFDRSCASG